MWYQGCLPQMLPRSRGFLAWGGYASWAIWVSSLATVGVPYLTVTWL